MSTLNGVSESMPVAGSSPRGTARRHSRRIVHAGPPPLGAAALVGRRGCSSSRRWCCSLTFTYMPVVNMFWYSVTRWDGIDPHKTFVGAEELPSDLRQPDNTPRVLRQPVLLRGVVRCRSALALYFATVLSFKVRFGNFFKGDPVLPVADERRRDRVHLPVLLPAGRHPRLGARPRRAAAGASTSGSATRTSSTTRWPDVRSGDTWD